MSLKKAYTLLVFAILAEVLATSAMKASDGKIIGFICMYILLVLSYYLMAISLKRLSISVAYAIWEVLGVLCIVGIGIFYFHESLSLKEWLGLACSICGIMLINYAEITAHKDDSKG